MKLYYGMMQKYPNELLVLRWWYQYYYNYLMVYIQISAKFLENKNQNSTRVLISNQVIISQKLFPAHMNSHHPPSPQINLVPMLIFIRINCA